MRNFYSGLLGYFACAAFLLAVALGLQTDEGTQPVWSHPGAPARLATPPKNDIATLRDVVAQPIARRSAGATGNVAVSPEVPGDAEAINATAEPDSLRGVVLGDVVNLRAGPSTAMAVVGAALKGERLELTGVTEGNWVEVVNPDTEKPVWIHGRMLERETSPIAEPTQASL